MASPNEISMLKKISFKPQVWRIEQQDNGEFKLAFSYLKISSAEWQYIQTQRGKIKKYQSADACLNDIARVQPEATIHAVLNPITN